MSTDEPSVGSCRFACESDDPTEPVTGVMPGQTGTSSHHHHHQHQHHQHHAPSSPSPSSSSSHLPLTQHEFRRRYQFVQPTSDSCVKSAGAWLQSTCRPSGSCVTAAVKTILPVAKWLPRYNVRDNLFGDIIAGATTAVMHIPQGMAYALLARIPPIHGIYMAFFQCLIYVLLGTSRQVSVGTFAVTCIMTGKVVTEYSEMASSTLDVNSSTTVLHERYDPVAVASTVTLAVGIIEVAMFLLRMGALTVVLSDMLVKGFTTGAAVHVLMSQIKYLFGLNVPRYSGPGKLVKSFAAILAQVLSANPAAMVISGAAMCLLIFNNEYIKPRIAKKTRFPLPIELLVVIIGTLASYFGDLNNSYNVKVIGTITTGLPAPKAPIVSLIPSIMVDSIIIAVIGYSVSLSLAQLFAKKHEYSIDANQELVAYGVGNVVSSFFSCAPMAASLSRSLILDSVGGRTQASGLVTSSLLLVVLLWLGPAFETLPNCVLSAIIVVSLKGMFMQFADLKQVWRTSKADAFIWFSSFLMVVLVDIDYGLAAGVVISIGILLMRNQNPSTALLGNVPCTDLYLDVSKYHAAHEDMEIKIFQFGGPLHFCNRDFFRNEVVRLTGVNPVQHRAFLTKLESRAKSKTAKDKKEKNKIIKKELKVSVDCAARDFVNLPGETRDIGHQENTFYASIEPNALTSSDGKERIGGLTNGGFEPDTRSTTIEAQSETGNSVTVLADEGISLMFSSLVLEMSSVGFVDTASTRSLLALIKDFESIHVACYLAGCRESVLHMLQRSGCSLDESRIYASVHHAVQAIRSGHSGSCPDRDTPSSSCKNPVSGS